MSCCQQLHKLKTSKILCHKNNLDISESKTPEPG